MTKKIPFHHPRLSGSWAHNNSAMVIQENNPSCGSDLRSHTDDCGVDLGTNHSLDDFAGAHQSHEVVMNTHDGRPVVKFTTRDDSNALGYSHFRRKTEQQIPTASNSLMQAAGPRQATGPGKQQTSYADQTAKQQSQLRQKPGHKRVKSDAIDSQKIKMITDISGVIHQPSSTQPNSSGQRSLKQLQQRLTGGNAKMQELTQQ